MIKIDASVVLKDFENQNLTMAKSDGTLTDLSIGRALAKTLNTPNVKDGRSIDQHKLWLLSNRFYLEPIVEIDESDFNLVLDIVKNDRSWSVVVNGQVIDYLIKAKNLAEMKK